MGKASAQQENQSIQLVILAVWITSAMYSAPKFFWVNTITTSIGDTEETVCIANRRKFNSQIFDMVNFVFLYVVPLAIMTILYTRIAFGLWNSSRKLERQLNACSHELQQSCRHKSSDKKGEVRPSRTSENGLSNPNASQNVLRARRGVIRMLIVVVLTFALCNLPFHARKMWQYWSHSYQGNTNFSALLTPLTFLITYFNSGINPLLYAFLSKNFRRGMREMLSCKYFGSKYSQRQQQSFAVSFRHRRASSRSTVKAAYFSMDPVYPCKKPATSS
ncbi:trissin receptor-like isoform X2 [Photinus pyralis]|uniref:trissin receptor-like isoform X2 n=1 Tax=Photinus pyralis TaxID=7054 RepID=UPI00126782D7|nr:trissin receptor-like isoform X2 [Photinus pyralis]